MFFRKCILPEEFKGLCKNIDRYLIDERYFVVKKNDKTTMVGILKGEVLGLRTNLWVKRFNHTNFFKYIAKLIFGSRAVRLYRKSLDLYKRGFPVPEPIGYIELSIRNKNSYFISSVVEDVKTLSELYRESQLKENKDIIKNLAYMLAQWHLKGAIHGDLKWPNILVCNSKGNYKIYFVDLDQTRIYERPDLKGIRDDLLRFYRFAIELGVNEGIKKEFFDNYIRYVPARIQKNFDYDEIINNAHKKWIKKGSKRYY